MPKEDKGAKAKVTIISGKGVSQTINYLLEDRDELDHGFRRLSAEHRAILVLRHFQGLSVPEIAEALGIAEGTAKSRLHYATAALRAALEADQP